jgi:hypothetical protein
MAANTNLFTGSDATLTLSSEPGPEGDAAKTVITDFNLAPVGRAQDVEVSVHTDVLVGYELGKRHPVELRAGNIEINGKIARASINGALLKLLLGKGADSNRSPEPYPSPSFNLQLDVKDPTKVGTTSTLTVHGVKFETWTHSVPEDDFVMEGVTFKGLFVTVEDKVGT